ncbi:MAG TPA: hypothetical protein VIX41_03135 [Acidimicrobiales bacterium]
MNFLLLGIDSLIACLAIGALVDRRSWVWLALLFGVADAGAFLIGAGLGWGLMSQAASELIGMGTFVLLGVYLLVVAAGTAQVTARRAVWLLPFALTLDNLAFGMAGEPTSSVLAQALSSGMLAYLGLFAAAWLPRVAPKLEATRVAGAALLIGAGALFLVG